MFSNHEVPEDALLSHHAFSSHAISNFVWPSDEFGVSREQAEYSELPSSAPMSFEFHVTVTTTTGSGFPEKSYNHNKQTAFVSPKSRLFSQKQCMLLPENYLGARGRRSFVELLAEHKRDHGKDGHGHALKDIKRPGVRDELVG